MRQQRREKIAETIRQEICDIIQWEDYEEYVNTDTKGVFALKVRGDSKEPDFRDGD